MMTNQNLTEKLVPPITPRESPAGALPVPYIQLEIKALKLNLLKVYLFFSEEIFSNYGGSFILGEKSSQNPKKEYFLLFI